jgi:Ca2+-binding RTX toxin-like protein
MANLKRISTTGDFTATEGNDRFDGTEGRDRIDALAGDDWIAGNEGNDVLRGGAGFDLLTGGEGSDKLLGGGDIDFVFGGRGDDTLFGDGGFGTTKGSDLSSDVLRGDQGDDLLVQGDGNDVMTGGKGADTFHFRWSDPMVDLAAGTGRAFTRITDFDAGRDGFQFDAAGVGRTTNGANFVDGGAGDGTAGGAAASFFSGAASGSNGEAVMVLSDRAFVTGTEAVTAAQGEAAGDLILYFNSTVGVASLLVVDGTDAAHSILRLTNIDSVDELRGAGFDAGDFVFV